MTLPPLRSTTCLTSARPKSGPAALAAARAVDAVEALEEPGEVLLGDSGAGVGDLEGDERVVGLDADADAADLGVGDRVVDEVVERDGDVGDVGRREDVLPADRREVGLERETLAAWRPRGGSRSRCRPPSACR